MKKLRNRPAAAPARLPILAAGLLLLLLHPCLALIAGIDAPGSPNYPDGGMRQIASTPGGFGGQAKGTFLFDEAAGYAYFVTSSSVQGKVIKIALGEGMAPPQIVATLNLAAADLNITCGVIDPDAGFLYFCAPGPTTQSPQQVIVKVAVGEGDAPPVRTGSTTLNTGGGTFSCAVFNPADHCAYFATDDINFRVARIVSDQNATPTYGGVSANSTNDAITAAVLNPAASQAVFLTKWGTLKASKVTLGDPPVLIGPDLDLNEAALSGAIDPTTGVGYFGAQSALVRVDTSPGAGPLQLTGSMSISGDQKFSILDAPRGLLYLSTDSVVTRLKIEAGDALPTPRGALAFGGSGQRHLYGMAMDSAGDYAWMAFSDAAENSFIKLALRLNHQGLVKATRFGLTGPAQPSSVHFYSHTAVGNLRLAIYSDDGGRDLIWESGPFANTVQEGWITAPIAAGTPSSLTLAPGSYWLAWQTDTAEAVGSYTFGGDGDGYTLPAAFGAFPALLDGAGLRSTYERWSMYLDYEPVAPTATPAATPTPFPTGTPPPGPSTENMELLGTFGGKLTALSRTGSLLYLGEGTRLTVVDASDPAAMAAVGGAELSSQVHALASEGDYVYAALGEGGMRVIDVHDPANPQLRGVYRGVNPVIGVAVKEGSVIAAAYSPQRIDVSDPDQPFLLTKFSQQVVNPTNVPFTLPMVPDGNLLSAGAWLIGLSDPNALEPLANLTGAVFAPSGDYLYAVTKVGYNGIFGVYDLLDPYNPSLVGQFPYSGRVVSLLEGGGVVCIFTETEGIVTIDVSNPRAPRVLENFNDGIEITAGTFDADRSLAFALTPDKLIAYNIALPSGPIVSATFPNVSRELAASGTRVFSANVKDIQLIDCSNPAEPRNAAKVTLADQVYDMACAGPILYAGKNKGIAVIDATDMDNPIVYSSPALGTGSPQVRLADGLAFLAFSTRLLVLDVSEPLNPLTIFDITLPRPFVDARYEAGLLHVISGYGTYPMKEYYDVYDISVRGAPAVLVKEVFRDPTPDALVDALSVDHWCIELNGGHVYLIDTDHLPAPEESGDLSVISGSARICADGRHLYAGGPIYQGTASSFAVVDLDALPAMKVNKAIGLRDALGAFISIKSIAVSGDYAYVCGGDGMMRVIDLNYQKRHYIAGDLLFPGAIGSAESANGTLAVAGAEGVWLYGLADPESPALYGNQPIDGGINQLSLKDGRVGVATQTAGLRIVDVANPTTPVLLGGVDEPASLRDVALTGAIACAAHSDGMELTSLTPPQPVGSFDIAATAPAPSVSASGLLAAFGDGYGEVQLLGISIPALPVPVATYRATGAVHCSQLELGRMIVSGTSLEVVDVRDAAAPKRLGLFGLGTLPDGDIGKARPIGDLAFVPWNFRGVRVLNIKGLHEPEFRGLAATAAEAADVAVAGSVAVVLSAPEGGAPGHIWTFNVSNPHAPVPLGSVQVVSTARRLAVQAGLAFVAAGNAGLQIVDISNPASPQLLSTLDTSGSASDVAVAAGVASVADGAGGLLTIGFADPANPVVIASVPPVSGRTYDSIDAEGTRAVIGANKLWEAALLVSMDLSNPAAPASAGAAPISSYYGGDILDVLISGNRAFAAVSGNSLLTYELGANSATLRGSCSGSVKRLLAAGDRVLVTGGNGAVSAFDVSRPAEPALVCIAPLDGEVLQGMAFAGAVPLVAGADGLRTLDLSAWVTPTRTGQFSVPNGPIHSVAVRNTTAYAAAGDLGMYLLRYTGPGNTAGRRLGDFDGSGCTDLADFLILIDNWQTEFEGETVGLPDFLNLIDNWQLGPDCD